MRVKALGFNQTGMAESIQHSGKKHAYIADEEEIFMLFTKNFDQNITISLTFLKERFSSSFKSFALPKDFFLFENLDKLVGLLKTNGIADHLIKEDFSVESLKLIISSPKPTKLNLDQLAIGFYVYGIFLVIASIAFLLEGFTKICHEAIKRVQSVLAKRMKLLKQEKRIKLIRKVKLIEKKFKTEVVE